VDGCAGKGKVCGKKFPKGRARKTRPLFGFWSERKMRNKKMGKKKNDKRKSKGK